MDRSIRFKEWGINVDTVKSPAADYISKCNSTLISTDYKLRTDADGNILTGNNVDANSDCILCLGDSFVESLFVSELNRFCSVLERSQDALRVINGGYSGATSLHMYINLLAKHLRYAKNIKLILYFQPFCDSASLVSTDDFWANHPFFSPVLPVSSKPVNLYNRATDFSVMSKIHNSFYYLCQQFEVPVYFVKTPFGCHEYSDTSFLCQTYENEDRWKLRRAALSRIQSESELIASKANVNILPLSDILNNDPSLFYDELHLNEYGSSKVGAVLSDLLSNFR